MKVKFKNRTSTIILSIITILSFSSCKNNPSNVDNIEKPNTEKIKDDLIGQEIDNWSFKSLEQFKSANIEDSQLVDNQTLKLNVRLSLIDNETDTEYTTRIKVIYLLNDKNEWEFNSMDGKAFINSPLVVTREGINDLQIKAQRYEQYKDSLDRQKQANEQQQKQIEEEQQQQETRRENSICKLCHREIINNSDLRWLYDCDPYYDLDYLAPSSHVKGPFHETCAHDYCNGNYD